MDSVPHLDTIPLYTKDHLSKNWLWKKYNASHQHQYQSNYFTRICANCPGELKLQSKAKFEFNTRVFWTITQRSVAGDYQTCRKKPAAPISREKYSNTQNQHTLTASKNLEIYIQFKSTALRTTPDTDTMLLISLAPYWVQMRQPDKAGTLLRRLATDRKYHTTVVDTRSIFVLRE